MDDNQINLGIVSLPTIVLPATETKKPKNISLPAGIYRFTVADAKCVKCPASGNKPEYDAVIVKMNVDVGDGTQAIHEEWFPIQETMYWKIMNFFCCLGLIQREVGGEADWSAVIGRSGRAHFTAPKTIYGKNGEKEVNNIDKFFEAESPAPSAPQTTTPQTTIPQYSMPQFGPGNRTY